MRTKYFNEVDGSISAKDGDGMVDHKIAIKLSLLLLMEEIMPAPATKYTAVIVDGDRHSQKSGEFFVRGHDKKW